MTLRRHITWWIFLAPFVLAAILTGRWAAAGEGYIRTTCTPLGCDHSTCSMTRDVTPPNVVPRGKGDLNQRIAQQEDRAQHAWNAALDAKSEFWGMYNDWANAWFTMHDQGAFARLMGKKWREYDKAMRTWQRECVVLVKLYDEHRQLK